MSKYYIYLFNFIIGSIIGSHLLVVVQRFETENFISSTSHCDSCKIPLTLLNQIPIFSFIKYKGHCFFCKTTIPIETFYCELLGGITFLPLNPYTDQFSYLLVTFIFLISIFDYFDQSFPLSTILPLIWIITFSSPKLSYDFIEWMLIIIVISVFLLMNLKNKLGLGDTLIFIILIFYYNFYIAQYIFLIASIFLFLLYVINHEKRPLPFIPFIFLSITFYNFV